MTADSAEVVADIKNLHVAAEDARLLQRPAEVRRVFEQINDANNQLQGTLCDDLVQVVVDQMRL